MKRSTQARLVAALGAIAIAGCAGPAPSMTPPANVISSQRAIEAVTVGRSTKGDVIAALGKTTVISFDSGFEVWVYRVDGDNRASAKQTMGRTEYVLLFAPTGTVVKTRIRPAPG